MDSAWCMFAVLAVILVVILAVLVARCAALRGRGWLSGKIAGGARRKYGGGEGKETSLIRIDGPHPGIESALHDYALSLGRRTPPDIDFQGGAKRAPSPKKPWTEHDSWESLMKDRGAYAQYIKDRADVLNSLDLDWGDVKGEIMPLLHKDHEYIGLIDVHEADLRGVGPKKLKVTLKEASPVIKGTIGDGITFASIPTELVEKVAKKPAMFIFHTHPDDPKGSPLPSSADVSTAISMGYAGMYAANVMISRYGIFVYTPSQKVYKDIHASSDPDLAMRHYRHDAVAAMESIRSWKDWSLDDYQRLYSTYKMLYVVYPTPIYTAHSYLLQFKSFQDAPSDEDILSYLRHDIEEHRKRRK